MSLTLVAASLIALGLIALLRYGGTTPGILRVPPSKLEYYLSQVLRRGYSGGIAIVRDRTMQRFVRVSKYFETDLTLGLEVSVPVNLFTADEKERLAEWANTRRLELRPFESTARAAVPYPSHFYTRRRATEVNSATMVAIDCKSDVAMARDIVASLFLEVLGVNRDADYSIEFWGISALDELVDRP